MTSPAYRHLDKTIVHREANLVVQGASAELVMSPAEMADGEVIGVELLGSFSNGSTEQHGEAP